MRNPNLRSYAESGDKKFFDLWKKLNTDPTDFEIRRNIIATQPLLWIANPDEIPLIGKSAAK